MFIPHSPPQTNNYESPIGRCDSPILICQLFSRNFNQILGGDIRNIYILLLLSLSYSATLLVPDEYSTIQAGIDAAMDGDTVVVYPSLYEENILIDKSITLTSLALFDTTTNTIAQSLDNWVEYNSTFAAWEVADELINSTIIDGSGETKSTITIATEEDICIEPIILGFTIQDGSGTLMDRFYENGNVTIQQYMGGGILSYLANPILHYNKIQNNGGLQDVIKSGSAIYPASSSDDIDFIDRNTERNRDCGNDVFDFTHNFFENNTSSLGRHIGNRYFDGEFDLSNCVFDYWNCQDEGVYQTPIWVNIDDLDNLVAEDEDNSGCLLTGDFYVNPENGDDDLNDGQSWESPFYTITNTLSKVVGTEQNPVNIYLAEGIYSPSTNGETFPIIMFSFINLIGQGEEVTIMDAEQTDRVIMMEICENNTISDLTITGGFASGGSAIKINESNLHILNCLIKNNKGYVRAAIEITYSNAYIENSRIINNQGGFGGGIFSQNSYLELSRTTIAKNYSLLGGGIFSDNGNIVFDTANRCNIYSNYAGAGNDIVYQAYDLISLHVVVDTFTVLEPTTHNIDGMDFFGGNENMFTYDINYRYFDPVDSDLYVSPTGSNENNGLSEEMPLRTISFALNKIVSNSSSPNNIYLSEGIYSPESELMDEYHYFPTNDQYFPLNVKSNVSIIGNSISQTILDIDSVYSGIFAIADTNVSLVNMTIKNAYSGFGGVLWSMNSDVEMHNMLLYDNYGEDGSVLGAMFSNIKFVNVTITNNTSYQNEYSGIFEIASSNIEIINSIFWNNAPRYIINVGFGDGTPLPPNQISILNSDIEGGQENLIHSDEGVESAILNWAESNLDIDPIFSNANDNDFSLQENSPCIDAGTTDTDGDGYEDITDYCGEAPDMGAYEYITEDCVECGAELADVNGDSQINILDLVQISYYILELSTPLYECAADYNSDGEVNILDLVQIANYILDN